jgi:hypothetical protein
LRPEKVGRESVEDEDELEPWWWEMARATRACESVRDEVEAMAYAERKRERERERDGVGESELLDLCVRLREGEGETAELLVYTSGNDDR